MKRRGFLGSLLGGSAAVAVSPVSANISSKNPLVGGEKMPFVRVFYPVKIGDRLIVSKVDGDYPHAHAAVSGEVAHCVSIMNADLKFYNPKILENGDLEWISDKGRSYSSVIVVNVLS